MTGRKPKELKGSASSTSTMVMGTVGTLEKRSGFYKPRAKPRAATNRRKREEVLQEGEIDFTRVHQTILKRYKRCHNLPVKQDATSLELARSVASHFRRCPVSEGPTLQLFIYTVKSGGNLLDKKREAAQAAKESS